MYMSLQPKLTTPSAFYKLDNSDLKFFVCVILDFVDDREIGML